MYLSRYISWQPANFNMGYVSPTLAPGDLATKTKLSEFRNATDTQKANSTATAFAVNFLPIQAPNLDRVKQQRLSGHGRSVLGVTFSPDSTLLATAGLDGTLRLWDAKTGTSLRVIDGGWELRDVAISPDGHWAAFSSFGSKSLQLMDLQTYEIRHTWFDLSPTTLSFSPDSKLIAFSDRSGNVHIRDIASEKEFATINGGLDVEFNPNGKLLAIASGTQIHLWDASTFQRVAALPNPKYNGSEPKWVSLVFSPNGKFLAATNGPLIGIWDTEKRRIVSTITHETRFFGLAFSPDGTLLAAGRIHDMVSLYSTETGSFIANIGTRQELERVAAVAFSPNGRFLAAGGDGNIITLWSVPAK
jgi:WD40 repeat protein